MGGAGAGTEQQPGRDADRPTQASRYGGYVPLCLRDGAAAAPAAPAPKKQPAKRAAGAKKKRAPEHKKGPSGDGDGSDESDWRTDGADGGERDALRSPRAQRTSARPRRAKRTKPSTPQPGSADGCANASESDLELQVVRTVGEIEQEKLRVAERAGAVVDLSTQPSVVDLSTQPSPPAGCRSEQRPHRPNAALSTPSSACTRSPLQLSPPASTQEVRSTGQLGAVGAGTSSDGAGADEGDQYNPFADLFSDMDDRLERNLGALSKQSPAQRSAAPDDLGSGSRAVGFLPASKGEPSPPRELTRPDRTQAPKEDTECARRPTSKLQEKLRAMGML